MSLFEVIDEDEFKKAQAEPERVERPKKGVNTDDRTITGWMKLNHFMDFCTVPTHDDVIRSLSGEAKEYRQQYPVRMVYKIGEFQVCRDCFVIKEDLKH